MSVGHILLVPKPAENEQVPWFNGTWKEYAVSNTQSQGHPIYRSKQGTTYLCVQSTIPAGYAVTYTCLTTTEFLAFGFDPEE